MCWSGTTFSCTLNATCCCQCECVNPYKHKRRSCWEAKRAYFHDEYTLHNKCQAGERFKLILCGWYFIYFWVFCERAEKTDSIYTQEATDLRKQKLWILPMDKHRQEQGLVSLSRTTPLLPNVSSGNGLTAQPLMLDFQRGKLIPGLRASWAFVNELTCSPESVRCCRRPTTKSSFSRGIQSRDSPL